MIIARVGMFASVAKLGGFWFRGFGCVPSCKVAE